MKKVAFAMSVAAAAGLAAPIITATISPNWKAQHFGSAVAIALSNNVDNLAARLAYCVQGTKVPVLLNAWISLITFAVSTAAAYLGLGIIFSLGRDFTSLVAMMLFCALGLSMMRSSRRRNWEIHHHPGGDVCKDLGFVEGTVLGATLSVNNIAGGVSAGVLGVAPLLVGGLSALVSFACLLAGNYLAGLSTRCLLSQKVALAGGFALILIGLKQIF